MAALAWSAPKAPASRPRGPETAQSLVLAALQRAQVDLARDACLIGVEVRMGCSYVAGVGWGLDRKDVEYYFDEFSYWFKSPRQQWYQRISRCDAAGDYGMDQPDCMAPLGVWSSQDRKPGKFTPNGKCLDEMAFDSNKAMEAALAKGLSNTTGCFMFLYLRSLESKAKKFARLNGKTFWVATDEVDPEKAKRCVAFSAADGEPLWDGACAGLLW